MLMIRQIKMQTNRKLAGRNYGIIQIHIKYVENRSEEIAYIVFNSQKAESINVLLVIIMIKILNY